MTTQLQPSPINQDAEPAQARPARYRALYPAAVVSLIFGVLSVLTFLDWFLGIIPAVGIAAGWTARRRILGNAAEVTGLALAWAGMGASLGLGTVGYGWLIFARVYEVPFGYQRVLYEDLQPDPKVPDEVIPPEALRLHEKKVFVKGYMAPTRQLMGLRRFVLCPAIPGCPFCPTNPQPTEMILVTLTGDLRTDYTTHVVRLGGTFKVDPKSRIGIPYAIEADYLR